MDDVAVGRMVRAVRHRLGRRQQDIADAAGVSRQVVSRIERGRIDEVSITALRAVARRLEMRIDFAVRWRGGELDRLVNRRHAAMHEAALAMFAGRDGWQVVSELSFNEWGERGIIDLVGWHAGHRALAIIELKSAIVDPGELVGTMDRRRRLGQPIARSRGWDPEAIGIWVLVDDTRTNRRHLAASRRLLRGAFPADGHELRRWLSTPSAPIAGLAFLTSDQSMDTSQRVRPGRPATGRNRGDDRASRPSHERMTA